MVVWPEFNSVAGCSSVTVTVCGIGMYVCLEIPSRGALYGDTGCAAAMCLRCQCAAGMQEHDCARLRIRMGQTPSCACCTTSCQQYGTCDFSVVLINTSKSACSVTAHCLLLQTAAVAAAGGGMQFAQQGLVLCCPVLCCDVLLLVLCFATAMSNCSLSLLPQARLGCLVCRRRGGGLLIDCTAREQGHSVLGSARTQPTRCAS
jgi:hypothetical protein